MAKAKPKHLLDGYRVLDFTHFVAGPTATRMMAGMGAEIIKVELAPHGDEARQTEHLRKHAEAGRPRAGQGTDPQGRRAHRELCARRDRKHGTRLRDRQGAQSLDRDVLDFNFRTNRPALARSW